MRGRLNKTQIQMLLDGKSLKSGRLRFVLPEGPSELRKALEALISKPEALQLFTAYIDMNANEISIEKNK